MADDNERYMNAAHGVQTGVAYRMERDPSFVSPKHLRVGIDLQKADTAGLVRLLIAKGVFTEAEYLTAIADSAEAERDEHARRLSEQYGANITLG